MILDAVSRASLYKPLAPRIATALSFIEDLDATAFRPGKVEIREGEIFALLQEYLTESAEGRRYEAHREYIDIQYLLSGEEVIRVTDLATLAEAIPYDPENDIAFYHPTPGNDLLLREGDFVILFPHEAHLPKIPAVATGEVRKVVMKVRG